VSAAAAPDVVRADFSTEPDGTPDGDFVEREVPVLFRAGDYEFPDQPPFSMTADDIKAAVAAFSPVPIEDNHRPDVVDGKHRPSVLKGKLGRVEALVPSADFGTVGAKLKVSKWLHNLYRGQPIGCSCTWDRLTKKLKDVSLTYTPRITEAVLFAAFAADEAAQEAGAQHSTPHGQKLLQFIHDHAAMAGARCSPGDAAMSADVPFTADQEASTIQKVHDLTLGSGAQCAIYRKGMGENRDWRPGQYYDTAVNMMPRYRDYQPGAYAAMSADAPPPTKKEPEPTPRERALQAELDRVKADREREAQARRDAEFSAAAGHAAAQALLFAQSLVGRHVLPSERDLCAADLRQAALDDLRHAAEVTFSDDQGREVRGTRLDAAKARWRARDVSHLTKESVPDSALFTLPASPDARAAGSAAGALTEDEQRKLDELIERHNRRRQGAAAKANGPGRGRFA
jgi:hypothetical protein